MDAVADFISVVPYAGVSVGFKLDTPAAAVLLALLPPELQAGLSVPPQLPPDDVKHVRTCMAYLVVC
jgi:hypothetical protein